MKKKIVSTSSDKTKELGFSLAGLLEGSEIISLEGQLGAGKTVFVKGLAKGLIIKEKVTSPTFVIFKQYKGKKDLNHFDLYRITQDDFIDLGYRDYLFSDSVSVIEWGKRAENILPQDHLSIVFNHGKDVNTREINIETNSDYWSELVQKWLA